LNLKNFNAAFIGAGKISYTLIPALIKTGLNISLIISKNINDAEQAAKKFKIKNYSSSYSKLSEDINFILLAVPDNEIEKSAAVISKLKINFKEKFILHFSGALTSASLAALKNKGAATASFHVMQSFPSKDIVPLKNSAAAIETDVKEFEMLLTHISKKLKIKPLYITKENKIFYHLAGVYASNFLTGNLIVAESLFKKAASNENFMDVYASIINSTLANTTKLGTVEALSGPVQRGDWLTVEKHLNALKSSDIIHNYIAQTSSLLHSIKTKHGKLNAGQKKIQSLLKDFQI
jgi:predicted short-subunit dehydrogenase-like oxidoreductase (DUF2520 family)